MVNSRPALELRAANVCRSASNWSSASVSSEAMTTPPALGAMMIGAGSPRRAGATGRGAFPAVLLDDVTSAESLPLVPPSPAREEGDDLPSPAEGAADDASFSATGEGDGTSGKLSASTPVVSLANRKTEWRGEVRVMGSDGG